MTAEIAVLNRSALALAADSAVTITIGETRKVYDSAEKLFEFCRKQPIALMIYNNVEFVGVPLDVLIRKFRAEHERRAPYATMKQAADTFLLYLKKFQHDLAEEETYLRFIVYGILKGIDRRLGTELGRRITSYVEGGQQGNPPTREGVLTEMITAQAAKFKAAPLRGYLPNVTLAAFRSRFGNSMARAFADAIKFQHLSEPLQAAITELGFRVMKSRIESPLLTGLVFGGFAKADMFPTLRSIEIDGVFFGEVKVLSVEETDIDRKKKRADVIPFAQKEMVERFMFGFDAEFQGNVEKFVEAGIDEILDSVEEDEEDKGTKEKFRKLINKNFSEMLENLKEKSRRELIDIVYFMSKKELADIAYALVEVTSHKRRFTTDEATVGGPIDVAVLTKSEGLIWIRRKHYFGQEQNQGFLTRTFGKGETNNGREKAPSGQKRGS